MSNAISSSFEQFRTLAARAHSWLHSATPAQLWDALQHGGIDAQVDMRGVSPSLGRLGGPAPTFANELRSREWGPGADVQDLAAWFFSSRQAQTHAAEEIGIQASVFFDFW
jgi:hypothetical protein